MEQMGNLQARWDKFELMMQSHQLMVKEQVSTVRQSIVVPSTDDVFSDILICGHARALTLLVGSCTIKSRPR